MREFLQFRAQKARLLQERLASDYDELANHYDELAAELADETWLPLENEALLRVEKDIGSEMRVRRGDFFSPSQCLPPSLDCPRIR